MVTVLLYLLMMLGGCSADTEVPYSCQIELEWDNGERSYSIHDPPENQYEEIAAYFLVDRVKGDFEHRASLLRRKPSSKSLEIEIEHWQQGLGAEALNVYTIADFPSVEGLLAEYQDLPVAKEDIEAPTKGITDECHFVVLTFSQKLTDISRQRGPQYDDGDYLTIITLCPIGEDEEIKVVSASLLLPWDNSTA